MNHQNEPHLPSGLTGFYDDLNRFIVTGSQMGRKDFSPWSWNAEDEPFDDAFRLFRMKMSPCGAYDHAGAYWGVGNADIGWMYRAYCSPYNMFVRARSRREAKELLKQKYPLIRFIN